MQPIRSCISGICLIAFVIPVARAQEMQLSWGGSGAILQAADLYAGSVPGEAAGLEIASISGGGLLPAGIAAASPAARARVRRAAPVEDRVAPFYVAGKAGPLWFLGDLDDLGVGVNTEVAAGWRPDRLFAVELFTGFLWGEDWDGADKSEVWAVPLGVNGEVILPISLPIEPKVEAYGGGGVAGYFIHTLVNDGSQCCDDEDVVVGVNGFVGLRMTIDRFLVGIEGKYFITDAAEYGNGRANLQGISAMVWVGFQL